MAGTRPVWPVFFPVRNRRVEHTGLLAGTVYSGRTGRYGMESITLILSHSRCPYIFLDKLLTFIGTSACKNVIVTIEILSTLVVLEEVSYMLGF